MCAAHAKRRAHGAAVIKRWRKCQGFLSTLFGVQDPVAIWLHWMTPLGPGKQGPLQNVTEHVHVVVVAMAIVFPIVYVTALQVALMTPLKLVPTATFFEDTCEQAGRCRADALDMHQPTPTSATTRHVENREPRMISSCLA
jgi:hypothetical protein